MAQDKPDGGEQKDRRAPRPGEDGFVERRMRETAAEGFAKALTHIIDNIPPLAWGAYGMILMIILTLTVVAREYHIDKIFQAKADGISKGVATVDTAVNKIIRANADHIAVMTQLVHEMRAEFEAYRTADLLKTEEILTAQQSGKVRASLTQEANKESHEELRQATDDNYKRHLWQEYAFCRLAKRSEEVMQYSHLKEFPDCQTVVDRVRRGFTAEEHRRLNKSMAISEGVLN